MAHLSLLDENGLVAQRWELDERPLAVGRGEAADVIIDDASLSRRHFIIQQASEGYLLQDLDSQNGTWVDGQRAETTRLHHHDCIAAGRTLFMFNDPRAAETEAKPLPAQVRA
jgi:pSer/pThr/pTyr-binding forkhead associated (FHA) protein